MKHKYKWAKNIGVITLFVTASVFLAGCGALDVVSNYGQSAFAKVSDNRGISTSDGALKGFQLNSKEGDLMNISFIKSDFGDLATNKLEISMRVDAAPFLAAGLKPERLISKVVSFDSVENKLIIKRALTDIPMKKFREEKATTMAGLFNMLIQANPDILGYHEKLGHFGLAFGEGFMFEWAKDLKANDKDIVWVFDPAVLTEAGVNPESVKGWVYADVPVMDKDGRKLTVKKFLRPYNLD